MIAGAIGLRGEVPDAIYAIVRRTFVAGREVETAAIDDPFAPGAAASLRPGQPWLVKRFVDVVIEGPAWSMRPVPSMRVRAVIGDRAVALDVLGRRVVHWVDGRPRFGDPEPFTRMDLGWHNAYGGVDLRVPAPDDVALTADHPGLYPRNPFGKGYVVAHDPVQGLELPNVEDPSDRLTPERLVLGDPAKWHGCPMPAGFSPMHPRQYARMVHYGVDAWFPPPDDERLAEVRTGMLPTRFRRFLGDVPSLAPHPGFFQEAPAGLRFANLSPGTPVTVSGMHPGGRTLRFDLPAAPATRVALEGHVQTVTPRLGLVRIVPETETVELTYTAVTPRMHRVFVPGVHGRIPLSLHVDGADPVRYAAPPVVGRGVAGP